MYQDEEEKELGASGFRVHDDDDADADDATLPDEPLDFGDDDDDPENRFH